MDGGVLFQVGILLMLIGFFAVIGSAVLGSKDDVNVKGGVVVFIGPIPLIFGTGRGSALAISCVAVLLMVVYYMVFR